jgi:colicin import membrane protein
MSNQPRRAAAGQTPQRRTRPGRRALKASDISAEEQVQIIGQINEVLARNRIQIQPDTFRYTPKRKGSPIPLLINLGALAVLALAAYLLFSYFNREEQALVRPATAVLSAEAKLLQTFKRESEAQLAEKDQEISAIRGHLDDLRREAERVRLDSEAQIRRREVELKAELARQLEAERRRLEQSGIAAANVEQQLRSLEERLRAENQRQLEQFQAQASAELSARERELADREAQYRQQLQGFQQDRLALEQQLREREADMEARRQSETAALERERSRTAQELATLTDLRRREQAALDQIAGSYSRISSAMRARQYDTALGELAALEGFLGQEAIVALPAVQSRLGVERFVISSLRALVDKERAPPAGAGPEAARAQALLASVAASAAEAQRLARAGDNAGAQRYYQSAIDRIPELQESHAYLMEQARRQLELAGESSSETARRLRSELDQARSNLRQQTQELGRLKATLERAEALIKQHTQQISVYQEAARKQEARSQQLGTIRSRYAAAAGSAPGSTAVSQAQILALVDTKIKLREVVGSEPVKGRYPELAKELEDYFAVYGDAQSRQGQEEALKDAITVLDSLLGKAGAVSPAGLAGRYQAAGGDPFGRYLEKLAELLR